MSEPGFHAPDLEYESQGMDFLHESVWRVYTETNTATEMPHSLWGFQANSCLMKVRDIFSLGLSLGI